MPQLRHKHIGGRRKIGRKRFPNQSVKVKERAYKQAHELEENLTEAPMPSIILDLGVDKVIELIRSVTGSNEDAFQDVWEAILSDHVGSEQDIIEVAKEIRHKHNTEAIANEYKEASLDEPISRRRFGSDDVEFTFKSIIPAEQAQELDYPPRFHHQSISPKQIALDPDVQHMLKERFPNVSYRDAVRQLLGLPLTPKKRPIWQPWEDDIIKRVYSWGGTMAVHLELPNRDTNGIRARAKKLEVRFDTLRPKAEWLTTTEVAIILGTHSKRICNLVHSGKLTPVSLKYQGSVQFQFKPNELIKFLETQIWEYHAEGVARPYQEYIPASRKDWVTVTEAAKQIGCHTNTILRYKKLGVLECQVASPYQFLVRVGDVIRAKNLVNARRAMSQQYLEHACKWCGSHNIRKYGRSWRNQRQRWICKDCGHAFVLNGASWKMKTPQYIIDKAIELREASATHHQIIKQLQALYGFRTSSALLSRWFYSYNIKPPNLDKRYRSVLVGERE